MTTASKAFSLLTLLAATSLPALEFKAGVARRDITPAEPVHLAGCVGRTNSFTSVDQRIYVKALALQDAGGAITKLQSYDWPGNVRELRNVIERAVILARGGLLDFDLPMTASSSAAAARVAPRAAAGDGPKPEPEFLTEAELERRERENLLVILETANWKVKGPDGAAELLGVKPTTLSSRMRKMGIRPPD